ncbi:MAG: type II toxin-antitoxin system VapC family toxin [Leptolyngbyaceae bacterium]|nr:type II toxin-antitoxin system VapC family toxin [Leptolyngbyaceae bacterium]
MSLFTPGLSNDIFIAAITRVEIVAAITRRARSGSINTTDAVSACAQFLNDCQSEYQVVQVTEDIINSAIRLAEAHGLRGYDAVQLAAGREINALCLANSLPPVTFVSADNELNAAAVSEGLMIENPNYYP